MERVRVNRLSFSNGGWCVMLMLMLGGVGSEETIEIRRTKREKGNDVPDRANRNFRSKQKVE